MTSIYQCLLNLQIKKTTIKQKNKYVHSLTDDFKKINKGELKNADIDLTQVTINQAVRLLKQNIDDQKLAIQLDNGKIYMLNDNTINKLEKGLVDENAEVDNTHISGSDEEVKSIAGKVKKITLKVIEPDPEKDKRRKITGKTRPGGGFFKFLNNTIFDFSRYGVFKEIDSNNYHDNCLYLALKAGGLPDNLLQMLKIFVMNRIVPQYKLKEICETLQICIKLTSVDKKGGTRTLPLYGDKNNPMYEIGLIDEHYFIIEYTNVTSY